MNDGTAHGEKPWLRAASIKIVTFCLETGRLPTTKELREIFPDNTGDEVKTLTRDVGTHLGKYVRYHAQTNANVIAEGLGIDITVSSSNN